MGGKMKNEHEREEKKRTRGIAVTERIRELIMKRKNACVARGWRLSDDLCHRFVEGIVRALPIIVQEVERTESALLVVL